MVKKFLMASVLGLSIAAAAPTAARADVDIDLNVVIGVGGFGKNISCATGRRIVDRHFNRVRAVDCIGTTYKYIGHRKAKRFLIRVDARGGYIKSVERY
jgi:hypothetical protein